MKTLNSLLIALLLVVPAQAGQTPDLPATAAADGRFATLLAALQRTGLDTTLRQEGPFTVFAPTDDAFAALPEGALARLLQPENRDALRQVLLAHVVPGRVLSTDLLRASEATALSGARLPLGLRIGKANVQQADITCSNGVIHVIDRVLLPTLGSTRRSTPDAHGQAGPVDVEAVITEAIDRGVPLFNAGRHDECVRIYREAAVRLVEHGGPSLSTMDRMDLEAALAEERPNAGEHAWALRHAFDRILANLSFEPVREAELPAGFPAPGPVGHVVVKRYPRYRAARAEGGNSFWTLFRHIKKNDVAMTAPVEMTMDADMRMADMAFLYPSSSIGQAGEQGRVQVLDLEPVEVVSVGVRGRRDATLLERARKAIEAYLAESGMQPAGAWRVLGYNSPMVASSKQFWELQVPVRR